jgi:two-component system OmpR family sensor kinase
VKFSPGSLVMRVALTTALSALVASASVALISNLTAYRMARVHEDTTLRDAAETLGLELRAEGADPRWVADDEARELLHASIGVAVYERGAFLAGDRAIPAVPADHCDDLGTLRVCARSAGSRLAVVARDQRVLSEQQRLGVYASVLAVLVTSLLGALAALSIARVVTAPLDQLRRAVELVPDRDPAGAELGPTAGLVEVDALRESVRAALVRLGASMTQSRRFASDAAHELRTPLATLMGELELAAEQRASDDGSGLRHALRIAQRMSTLLDRLLILARLEGQAYVERLELGELLEEAIDVLPHASRNRVVVDAHAVGVASAVQGDRALLVSAVVNALENALKFSEQDVRVVFGRERGLLTVAFVDRGRGIDEPERERVFAAFYRTAASRSSAVPGHGIGLALIAHVLALHGGSARFVACDRGATLVFSLPEQGHEAGALPYP